MYKMSTIIIFGKGKLRSHNPEKIIPESLSPSNPPGFMGVEATPETPV